MIGSSILTLLLALTRFSGLTGAPLMPLRWGSLHTTQVMLQSSRPKETIQTELEAASGSVEALRGGT